MISMKGGKGKSSYVNNSQAQARNARSMLSFLEKTLDTMKLSQSQENLFTVADLGCSCGTNTLTNVDFIVRHISRMHKSRGFDIPSYQVFLSDLPSNDFNTLFNLLPAIVNEGDMDGEEEDQVRPYYAAGVPGSFYGRLFPNRSIDVFHSTFSLHWLSRVPESVADTYSKAYNKGRVFVHGASKATVAAYKHQFLSDFRRFLEARAREMKHGGAMYLVCMGRMSADPAEQSGAAVLFGTHFENAWDDLVQEGLLDSEKRDSFNIPVYAPSLQEFKEVVEANGLFAINKLELVRANPLVVDSSNNAIEVGQVLANNCRALTEVLVESHIGKQLTEELFVRLERRGMRHAKELMERMCFFHIVCSLSFM